MLLRAAAIVTLNNKEFETLGIDYFVENCDNQEKLLLIDSKYEPKQDSFFGLACKYKADNSQFDRFYGEIIPCDLLFKVGCMRQLGYYIRDVMSANNAI